MTLSCMEKVKGKLILPPLFSRIRYLDESRPDPDAGSGIQKNSRIRLRDQG
jgi:hypothetical protein